MIDIRHGGQLAAVAERKGDRIYVTAEVGPKKGQSLAVVSDESAALAATRRYMEGL